VPPVPRFALQDNPRTSLRIDRKFFKQLEDLTLDNNASMQRAREGMDLLVRYTILIVKAGAQARAQGPVAPHRRSRPELAYRIPVQRITGRYFAGWHLRRLGQGRWLLYNDTVESYLIEYGMYQRVRRPILKLSVISMLRFVQTTKTGELLVDSILSSRRDARGKFRSFNSRLRGSSVLNQAGPQSKLP
jgi:hypothetical protein